MKKLKKGIPFLIYMMIWSLYILFAGQEHIQDRLLKCHYLFYI